MAYKTLFVRIGRMKYYRGPQIGDEKPIGAGDYNKKHIGHEAYNFQRDERGFLYGYFEPGGRLSLEGIDKEYKNRDSVEGVLVVYVHELSEKSPKPYAIAGWHRNATVYKDRRCRPAEVINHNPHACYNQEGQPDYNILSEYENSFLLPMSKRIEVKAKAGREGGFFGRHHMFYSQDGKGGDRVGQNDWITKALADIEEYEENGGVNILAEQDPDNMTVAVQNNETLRQGQGVLVDSVLRKKIELHAMKRAEGWFREHYRVVDDVSSHQSYDLLCREKKHRRDNNIPDEIRVEVKGTQSKGERVVLTRNEVDSAKKNMSALFVTHSIKIEKGEASNGEDFVIFPWDIEQDGTLKQVMRYTYAINTNRPNAWMH